MSANSPPDWHLNIFTGQRAESGRPWFEIADFDARVGDLKTIWEPSRFDWLLAMAQRAALGDIAELERLNLWLEDWVTHNPPYFGPNWKCGQEASIRVMHLAMAAIVLGQVRSASQELMRLLELHLKRIAPTTAYAMGQDNNHGTSEAAALFVGGSWLEAMGFSHAASWSRKGRRMLEERAEALILPDGTFSQYSLNYHRLMLDTYSFTESWRRCLGLPAFSNGIAKKLQSATLWLRQMVVGTKGDAPNLGANDGAHILVLTDAEYRDFRPSVQWAAALFLDARAIAAEGAWDQQLLWLNLPACSQVLAPSDSRTFAEGGLHVLRNTSATAYLSYPLFKFRPSQSDLLHLDFWLNGDNVLRDGGTFSYNCSTEDQEYFSGVASHNTVQFDDRDQMPRIRRFLFGRWPTARAVRAVSNSGGMVNAAAAYMDYCGARHERRVQLGTDFLRCTDILSGRASSALIRWRLQPSEWKLDGNLLYNERIELAIQCNDSGATIRLKDGQESRHYLQSSVVPVLEVRVSVPSAVETEIRF